MAGFSLTHHRPCHARTSSDPSIPHPVFTKLEQALHNLKSSLTSSPSPNAQILCNALRDLANLYKSIDELLCLPTRQQSLSHPHQKKWVEKQLDGSIKLLDLTAAARDCIVSMREHIQDLRPAIRKKGGNSDVHIVSQKKLQRETRACFKLLKQIDCDKCGACSAFVKDWDLMMVDRVLVESKEIVISLFRSLMCLLSVPRPKLQAFRSLMCLLSVPRPKLKACRWVFFSKDGSEAQDQLEELEGGIEGLENGLDLLFRRLIENRVSLLNVLSV